MNFTKLFLATLCLAVKTSAMAAPLEILKAEGCDKSLQTMAQTYLANNAVLLSIYEDQSHSDRNIDLASLELCKSTDLDPGSFHLRRETTFCNKAGDSLTLYTYGNFFCSDETVLGIKSLKLK